MWWSKSFMLKLFSLLFSFSPFLLCLPETANAADLPIAARYQKAAWMGGSEPNALVYKANISPNWLAGGSAFWYRNEVRGTRKFVFVDGELGLRRAAFDHGRMAAALSQAAGQKYDAKHLPFSSITFAEENRLIRFRIGSQWWQCDTLTYACTKIETPPEPKTAPQTRAQERRAPEWTAMVRNNNVILKARDGQEFAATTDGTAKLPYAQPAISPDGRYATLFRIHVGDRREMTNVDSVPRDATLRPNPRTYVYALPGDKVDTYDVLVYDIAKRQLRPLQLETSDWEWLPDVRWNPDGRHFTLDQIFRAHARQRVLEADAETGTVRTLIDERSQTWVYPPFRYLHFMDKTGEILRTSERDGWNHLYLYDAKTGAVKTQITRGNWVVRGVESVDENKREIIFAASGREPGRDPYLVQFYRIGMDGANLTPLTPADGQHTIRFSPTGKFYIDSYSRVDLPPVHELRRTRDGALVCPLEKADIADLTATGWKLPEAFAAKGRDGKTDIWGVVFRPSAFDPKRKYPIVENIYAGPQGAFAPKTFAASRGMQALAELGFIVVQMDGMGTANRSKAFHDVAYKNLGDGGYLDRIVWMKALAQKYPYADTSRVGIYGMSAGGYNALRALLAHPEAYHVAVAEAGNHDHRTDKVWWNEVWMGYPVGKHYEEQSNVTQAHKLRGKLLLIHGELDDNVNPFASTMQVVNALIKANKEFDLLLVPGAGHGFGTYVTQRRWAYFVRNLRREEPPADFALTDQEGSECIVTVINTLVVPVTLYWLNDDEEPRRYQTIPPGGSIRQRTFAGHRWEARTDAGAVAWYTASAKRPEWRITE
jgi:dipeptidyl aminopeptidase/acylaminoacyl peptidase